MLVRVNSSCVTVKEPIVNLPFYINQVDGMDNFERAFEFDSDRAFVFFVEIPYQQHS